MVLALAVAGTAWLGAFSTFNITLQMRTAFWVQARVLSLYQTVVFGGMAVGAWAWGEVAHWTSLEGAYLLAGGDAAGAASRCTGGSRCMPATAPDLQPAARQEPLPAVQATVEEGPVLVQIEFEVGAADAPAFVAAMDEVGHLRRRNGALRWRLFQDVAEPTHWSETFVLGDWIEHQRLRARMTMADAASRPVRSPTIAAARRRVRRYMVARRHDSRFLLDEAEQAEVAATREGGESAA